MRVWIDLTNSPHVPFFAGLVRELSEQHEVVLTTRALANTVELIELEGFSYELVGRHYGAGTLAKLGGLVTRVGELHRHLRSRPPDVAISHSSFYSPPVARLLGVPCIYLNDNEHAAGNRVAFRFADRVMVPEFLDLGKMTAQGAPRERLMQYPGVKEGVYLWQLPESAEETLRRFDPEGRGVVVVRPEPATAQYYKARGDTLDSLLRDLQRETTVLVFPRSQVQREHFSGPGFEEVRVMEGSVSLGTIMGGCDLFIGAGGTMTREAAVLGVPTISVYQDRLLDVDRYLIDNDLMSHRPRLDAAEATRLLEEGRSGQQRADELLNKGRMAYELIRDSILEYGA